MPSFPCPDDALLERLLLGDADRLARHLADCDRCAGAVRALPIGQPKQSRAPVDSTSAAVIARLTPPVEQEDLTVHRLGRHGSRLSRRRFFREAQSMGALDHEHIVAVYQVDEDRGLLYIVMPLLKGETLHERLRRQKQNTPPWLPAEEVARIGREIAEGLAAAHERGLVHRDIKPANIWLETKTDSVRKTHSPAAARVKLLDFGIVRLANDAERLTAAGVPVGTPAFMAPEQALGDSIDYRCDLFSLGCVLYRMATGQLAFNGQSAGDHQRFETRRARAAAGDQPRDPFGARSVGPPVARQGPRATSAVGR